MLDEDGQFVVNLLNHMHTETNNITNNIIDDLKARITRQEQYILALEDRLRRIQRKWDSFLEDI